MATSFDLDDVKRRMTGAINAYKNDLGSLRTEVDTSLRNIDRLIDEVNRKWPFARDTELKLP